jgi:hypothetical protein
MDGSNIRDIVFMCLVDRLDGCFRTENFTCAKLEYSKMGHVFQTFQFSEVRRTVGAGMDVRTLTALA